MNPALGGLSICPICTVVCVCVCVSYLFYPSFLLLLFSGLCNNNLEREGNAGSFGQGISLKLGHQLAKSWTQTVRKQKLGFGSGTARGYLSSSFTCCFSQPKISGPVGCRMPGLRACQVARKNPCLAPPLLRRGLICRDYNWVGGADDPWHCRIAGEKSESWQFSF